MRTKVALAPGTGLTERRIALADGRSIRAVVAGTGEPTVVFEAGLSGAASGWLPVQRVVTAATATVSYDRSGLGGSDVDSQPRTLERLAADLRGVLTALKVGGPLILVGHSWGGPILRAFAADDPERVAGVVLVDATATPFMDETAVRKAVGGYRLVNALTRWRLHGPVVRVLLGGGSRKLDAADRSVMERDVRAANAWSTGLAEAEAILPSLPLLRKLENDGLPDVEVVAICGGRMARGDRQVRRHVISFWTDEMRRSQRGRLVIAEGSGHLVPQRRPDLVASEILRLVEVART